jgi:LiaI-LiaF-like transmembrane region
VTDGSKVRCGCTRCRLRGLMWPIMLIAVGAIFLVSEFTRFDFGDLWPLLLVVAGGVLLAQSRASSAGHIGP